MTPALENEVLLKPKPSLVDRSVLELSADKLVPPDIYVDRALLRARVGYDDVCEAGGATRGYKPPWSDFSDGEVDLVAEAKVRIQELQREAETLEEAYRSYQQRAVHSTISHMLPPRPLSPQPAHALPQTGAPLRKRSSHQSHRHSPHRSMVSYTSLSPQTTRAPALARFDPENTEAPPQPRVTFSEDHNQLQPTDFTDDSPHSLIKPQFLKDGSSSPSRRLSSTPLSSSWKKHPRDLLEGTLKYSLKKTLHKE